MYIDSKLNEQDLLEAVNTLVQFDAKNWSGRTALSAPAECGNEATVVPHLQERVNINPRASLGVSRSSMRPSRGTTINSPFDRGAKSLESLAEPCHGLRPFREKGLYLNQR
jgi:hypothetical protein